MALRQEPSPPGLAFGKLSIQDDKMNPPLASENFEDEDDFEDAQEEHTIDTMDLRIAFIECEVAIRKFFNNDFNGALDIMKPWCKTSLYHSLGTSIFEFIPAILTFDQAQISRTLIALKTCISICNKHRRNFSIVESLGTMIKKSNYCLYSDVEAHAELCYAEALLLQAAMTIMEGEDLSGLIRGTIKVKNCYNSYKECARIIDKKNWESEESKIHFQSGVRLGIATFNVMISLLPPKIISLLEFVGFSGNKSYGLSELIAGSRAPGLRSVLCELTLLAYNTVICHFTGANGDLLLSSEILYKELQVYPEGVWFLLFKGRLELLLGEFPQSLSTYGKAISSQQTWKNLKHLCYWEMMWIHCLRMDWRQASYCTQILIQESSWSRTIYSYCQASMLLQLGDPSEEEQNTCTELLRNASCYKQRIAGKSLPMEKFMIRRCERYQAQSNWLLLPAVELLCIWNMFPILARNERAAQEILKLIEKTSDFLDAGGNRRTRAFLDDNKALVRYLHGSLLAAMGLPLQALDKLDSVFEMKSSIKEDTFLLPYSLVEMAMCHHSLGDYDRAITMLQEARKKFSGYSLESRLHFRVHSKMEIVKEHQAEENNPGNVLLVTTV